MSEPRSERRRLTGVVPRIRRSLTSQERTDTRVAHLMETLRTGLWFVPGLFVVAAVGLVFTISVVVLQLASSQFSPRVLRTFLQDVPAGPGSQVPLGIFVATFVYLINHVAQSIRVVRIIESVTTETRSVIDAVHVDGGTVRFVRPVMSWSGYVASAFEEIREYGGPSLQVQRRLRAAIDELVDRVPESLRPPLERQRRSRERRRRFELQLVGLAVHDRPGDRWRTR